MNKRLYNQCPVSIYLGNLELKSLIDLYMHSKNTKKPFVSESALDQTSWCYEFSSYIENILGEFSNRQMEDLEKKTKAPSNKPTPRKK